MALAALSAAGCDNEEDERAARPPVDDCVYKHARDAGSAEPSIRDPRTLVLRLADLPRGAAFDSFAGVERIDFDDNRDEFVRRLRFSEVGRGTFKHGYRPPDQPGGEAERGRACHPATRIGASALVFADATGARAAYREGESVARSGRRPPAARLEVRASPVPAGDEARLIEAPHHGTPTVSRMVVWRDGRVIGMVTVEGRGGGRDQALLERLTRRQAEYVAAVAN